MTHEDITRMAREAGLFVPRDGIPRDGALARFAALAYAAGAAAERERNAQIADAHASVEGIAQLIAAEIRGQQ